MSTGSLFPTDPVWCTFADAALLIPPSKLGQLITCRAQHNTLFLITHSVRVRSAVAPSMLLVYVPDKRSRCTESNGVPYLGRQAILGEKQA